MVKFFIENAGCNIDENLNEENKTLNEEPMISSANEKGPKNNFKPPIVDEKFLFLVPSPNEKTELAMTKEPSKETEEQSHKTLDENTQNTNTIKND